MAPKRPLDSFSAMPTASTSNLKGKRVKFAGGDTEPTEKGEEDEFELEVDSKKLKEVVIDGYDSDSSAGSDGGFGVGGGRKGNTTTATELENAKADEDDDMFGDEPPAGEATKNDLKGKGKEFLDLGDIEGQEFGKGDDDDQEVIEDEEEEYLEEDDLANDDDAPRTSRNKAKMGYKLSSFNMTDELSEGRFATDGSYVANANDPLATHDTWLDGVSKASIKAARESKKRMDDDQKARDEAEVQDEGALAQERDDCLIGLLSLVREGETVARALARLGKQKIKVVKIKPKRVVKPQIQDGMDLDEDSTIPTPVVKSTSVVDPVTKKIDLLTQLASTLLSSHGDLEIYDQTYEDIIKTLKSEGAVRRDWVPPKDTSEESNPTNITISTGNESLINRPLVSRPSVAPRPVPSTIQFFYKWLITPIGQPPDQEFGPYSNVEITNWVSGGYFGDKGAAVMVRIVGVEGWKCWSDIAG